MTYKQIEASREVRLWIGQIIIPAATAFGIVMANPTVRQSIKKKAIDVKRKIQNKFSK